MLLPKRVKHRKQHRGRMTGEATRGNKVTPRSVWSSGYKSLHGLQLLSR